MKGKLFGIGIGPGDPELLTLKAKRLIEDMDVIAVPKPAQEKESLALKIVESFIKPTQEILFLVMPMTQDNDILNKSWREGAESLYNKILEGKKVAFLTLGDASLYSTYSYLVKEIKKLDNKVEIETIPGITSFAASAARINVPLTEQEESLLIIPAVDEPQEIAKKLDLADNLVLMKVSRNFPELVAMLKEKNLLEKSVCITRCGQKEERITENLEDLLGSKPDYMSLVIVKGGRDS